MWDDWEHICEILTLNEFNGCLYGMKNDVNRLIFVMGHLSFMGSWNMRAVLLITVSVCCKFSFALIRNDVDVWYKCLMGNTRKIRDSSFVYLTLSDEHWQNLVMLRLQGTMGMWLVTARVRSTREGTVFTGVCLSTFRGGTYLPDGGGVPTQVLGGGYLPKAGVGGGYLLSSGWGGGTYLGQGGGVPTQLWPGGGGTYLGRGGGGRFFFLN